MKYRIALWSGKGVYLNKEMIIEAGSVEEALIIASIKDPNCAKASAGHNSEQYENDERYTYLDRSEYGQPNIYLLTVNAIIKEIEEDTENEEVRWWYLRHFPEDKNGKKINKDVTFYDLYETLENYESVYKLLGDIDTVIRERLFQRLAQIMDVDYEDVYNQWMMCNEE